MCLCCALAHWCACGGWPSQVSINAYNSLFECECPLNVCGINKQTHNWYSIALCFFSTGLWGWERDDAHWIALHRSRTFIIRNLVILKLGLHIHTIYWNLFTVIETTRSHEAMSHLIIPNQYLSTLKWNSHVEIVFDLHLKRVLFLD